jgi:hypothetical protein
MANERKTEIITRNHFNQFLKEVEIEEQSSDNPKIDKLLKTASKGGFGKGYPEFIITYKTNSDLLIVIECKAKTKYHESKNRDKYKDFAVDGALLYASYMSKEFDVLAIAISGETKQELKISHFLHLKGEKKAVSFVGDKLLNVDEYLQNYLKSPEKFRQDYNALLDFTKILNAKLHSNKVLGSERSLLISAILIALENDAFQKSYASHKTPENLAKALTQTVSNELENADIGDKKLKNLNIQFSFINTDTSLSQKDNVLKETIDDIDGNINTFIKSHQYFDVLGQLYIEFLRYANSDKSLGIVLTPPHITELFSDLAQVNKNSIIYDNCTGTGGFLISAMSKMIKDAKGDETKIKEIKSKQLIGVEFQSKIFALAVSNMYIHQDGKTSIIKGSCFDDAVITKVKAKNPTVGFLNPPYKSDKKHVISRTENNNGASAFVEKELDIKLNSKHTLSVALGGSVLSTFYQPIEYYTGFHIFILTPRKQLSIIEMLYYAKCISSNKYKYSYGRQANKTLKDILIPKKIPTNTKASLISFYQQTLTDISREPINKTSLKISDRNWKRFKLIELFDIKGSKTTSIHDLEDWGYGKSPYVTTQATNNGTGGFYDFYTEKGGCLTVDSAVLGYCSYQENDFSASDHVEKLIPNFEMNKYIALFLTTILNLEQYRYNYVHSLNTAAICSAFGVINKRVKLGHCFKWELYT